MEGRDCTLFFWFEGPWLAAVISLFYIPLRCETDFVAAHYDATHTPFRGSPIRRGVFCSKDGFPHHQYRLQACIAKLVRLATYGFSHCNLAAHSTLTRYAKEWLPFTIKPAQFVHLLKNTFPYSAMGYSRRLARLTFCYTEPPVSQILPVQKPV